MIWMIILTFFLIYLIISIFFFKKPTLLRKPKKYVNSTLQSLLTSDKVLHISHRGGSRESLENTLDAFKNAIDKGTNMLEMDLCLTKDSEVVVIHDSNLERLCDNNKPVNYYNYDELPEFSDQVFIHFSNRKYCHTKEIREKYIPKLEDVFKAFPNMLINMEMKEASDLLINKTNELIKKYQKEDLIIWGTKKLKTAKQLKRLQPDIPIFFSVGRVMLTYLYYFTGLLPFIDFVEESLQIPMITKDFENWIYCEQKNYLRKCLVKFFFGLVKLINYISVPLYSHLKKRGVLVFYWVLNDDFDFEYAINSGVSGIMTDSPSMLYKYLKENNKIIKNMDIK